MASVVLWPLLVGRMMSPTCGSSSSSSWRLVGSLRMRTAVEIELEEHNFSLMLEGINSEKRIRIREEGEK